PKELKVQIALAVLTPVPSNSIRFLGFSKDLNFMKILNFGFDFKLENRTTKLRMILD
ncbi:4300_t:CDS:1, partial [Dentiscutata erythropus]